jgi:hypothetical protein
MCKQSFLVLIPQIFSIKFPFFLFLYSSNPKRWYGTTHIIILAKIKNDIEYNQKDTKTRGKGRDTVLIIIANLTFLFILPMLKVTILFNKTFSISN